MSSAEREALPVSPHDTNRDSLLLGNFRSALFALTDERHGDPLSPLQITARRLRKLMPRHLVHRSSLPVCHGSAAVLARESLVEVPAVYDEGVAGVPRQFDDAVAVDHPTLDLA